MSLTSILKQYAVSSFAPPSGGLRLRTLSFNTAVYWERKYDTLGNAFPGRVTEERHNTVLRKGTPLLIYFFIGIGSFY